jgi:hypothetical protein
MNTVQFTPMAVGLPNSKKEAEIISIYAEICGAATVLLYNFEYYLSDEKFDISIFFDFLKCKDPRSFLYQRWIDCKGLTFPGMSIEKIISADLIEVPRADFDEIIRLRTEVLNSIEKTNKEEVKFFFPLAKLFHSYSGNRDFALSYECPGIITKEFDAKLYQHVKNFSQSEEDNKILEAVQKSVDSLNKLVSLGLIRNNKFRYQSDLAFLINAIVFSNNEESPFSISPNLPRLPGFKQHFPDRRNASETGSPATLLKFELPIEEDLPEEMPEEMRKTFRILN